MFLGLSSVGLYEALCIILKDRFSIDIKKIISKFSTGEKEENDDEQQEEENIEDEFGTGENEPEEEMDEFSVSDEEPPDIPTI